MRSSVPLNPSTAPARTDQCGDCRHFTTPARWATASHPDFGHCAFMPDWRTPGRMSLCDFNPIRFEPRAEVAG